MRPRRRESVLLGRRCETLTWIWSNAESAAAFGAVDEEFAALIRAMPQQG